MLEAAEPDEQLAAQWRVAKEIRSQPTSGKARGLAFLTAVHPEKADMEHSPTS